MEERKNCCNFSSSMHDLTDFINEAGLVDLALIGTEFTWSNSSSASRIDLVLVTPHVLDSWPDFSLLGLQKTYLDHCPLLFHSSK